MTIQLTSKIKVQSWNIKFKTKASKMYDQRYLNVQVKLGLPLTSMNSGIYTTRDFTQATSVCLCVLNRV